LTLDSTDDKVVDFVLTVQSGGPALQAKLCELLGCN